MKIKCSYKNWGKGFVLSGHPYFRPAFTKQDCSNCSCRSIGTQTGMEDHLPERTQQIQQEQAQVWAALKGTLIMWGFEHAGLPQRSRKKKLRVLGAQRKLLWPVEQLDSWAYSKLCLTELYFTPIFNYIVYSRMCSLQLHRLRKNKFFWAV